MISKLPGTQDTGHSQGFTRTITKIIWVISGGYLNCMSSHHRCTYNMLTINFWLFDKVFLPNACICIGRMNEKLSIPYLTFWHFLNIFTKIYWTLCYIYTTNLHFRSHGGLAGSGSFPFPPPHPLSPAWLVGANSLLRRLGQWRRQWDQRPCRVLLCVR